MGLLWHILERHLDEADFLLEVWTGCLEAPDYTLDELAAGPEARVLAQLDALALAGAPIIDELLVPALERESLDRSLACAASLALLEVGTVNDCGRLLDILDRAEAGDERWLGVSRGIELSERAGLDGWLLDQLSRAGATSRVAALARAIAGRGIDPGSGLVGMLRSEDPHLLVAAAELARYAEDAQCLALVGPLARVDVPAVQRAAIETGLIRGLPGAWESAVYWAFTDAPCEFRRSALTWVAMLGDAACQRRLLSSLEVDGLSRDILWALGFGGHVEAVDAAVALLADGGLGPLAGELVSAVAGAPSEDETLWRDPTRAEAPSELESLAKDLSADIDEDPEDRLQSPNPEAFAAWWATRREQLVAAPRLLGGRPWSPEGLLEELQGAPLRRRHLLSLELQIRSGGAVRVATRSWAGRQREQLASLSPAGLTLRGSLSAGSS